MQLLENPERHLGEPISTEDAGNIFAAKDGDLTRARLHLYFNTVGTFNYCPDRRYYVNNNLCEPTLLR